MTTLPEPHTLKLYACSACGFRQEQMTNHYRPTWSWGNAARCPECGWKSPMETTLWICKEVRTMSDE